jgi:hypothetical protein
MYFIAVLALLFFVVFLIFTSAIYRACESATQITTTRVVARTVINTTDNRVDG